MDFRKLAPMFLAVVMIVTPLEALAANQSKTADAPTAIPPAPLCTQKCRNNLGRGLNLIFQSQSEDRRKLIISQETKTPTIIEMGIGKAEETLKTASQEQPGEHLFNVYIPESVKT